MKKNGFTLIELLGVVTILLLITLLVLPNITGLIKSAGDDEDEVVTEMIVDAAKLYVSDSDGKYKKINGNTYCITLETLVDEGYLKSPITFSNSEEDITSLKSIQLSYSDGFSYKLKDKNSCIEKVSGCTVVSGDLDTMGSEIQCGTEYFYVIDNDASTATLFSKYNLNIGNNVYSSMETGIQNQYALGYKSGYTTYGGISFTEITEIYEYFEYYENYLENQNSITINSVSLMTLNQAQALTSYDWLYSTSYWLGSSEDSDNVTRCIYTDGWYDCAYTLMGTYFYHVSSEIEINNNIYDGGYLSSDMAFGIRPVIIINKSDLS